MREDLLHLTDDDLAALTNRGTVAKAARELADGGITGTVTEDDEGTVTVAWSDGITTTLPGAKGLDGGRCTCPATTTCRHMVRLALLYRKRAQEEKKPAASREPWNPGDISDSALAGFYKEVVLKKLEKTFKEGLLVELLKGPRPMAHFPSLSRTLIFMVPGDLRYTHCSCAEQAPCSHVPLAVWAFRHSVSPALSSIEMTAPVSFPPVTALLRETCALIAEQAGYGMAHLSTTLAKRWQGLASRLDAEKLPWAAQAALELARAYESYRAGDARFSSAETAGLLGELLVRMRAITEDKGKLPLAYLRGLPPAGPAGKTGQSRYMGLGCDALIKRAGCELRAYSRKSTAAGSSCWSGSSRAMKMARSPARSRSSPPCPS